LLLLATFPGDGVAASSVFFVEGVAVLVDWRNAAGDAAVAVPVFLPFLGVAFAIGIGIALAGTDGKKVDTRFAMKLRKTEAEVLTIGSRKMENVNTQGNLWPGMQDRHHPRNLLCTLHISIPQRARNQTLEPS